MPLVEWSIESVAHLFIYYYYYCYYYYYYDIVFSCVCYAKIITRKLELFGHNICWMENDRKIKSVVFGKLEGTNKRGRPHKEWLDNITEWCGASIQELYHAALEKQKWRRIMKP